MAEAKLKEIADLVATLIAENEIMVFSATYCPFCTRVKDLFRELDLKLFAFEVDKHEDSQLIKDELFRKTKQRTVPCVFIRGIHIGGCDDTMKLYDNGTLFKYLDGTVSKEAKVKAIADLVAKLIAENEVMVFSATYCRFCTRVKDLFKKLDLKFLAFEVDEHEDCQLIKDELFRKTKQKTVPCVFIRGIHIGGCDDTMKLHDNGILFKHLDGTMAKEAKVKEIADLVAKLIAENEIMVFSATYCPFCTRVKDLFRELDLKFFAFEVDEHEDCQMIKDELFKKTNQKTVPSVFIRSNHIGGCDDTLKAYESGSLSNYLDSTMVNYKFDFIVIGGGSGGIAAAKEAAALGKKVALFDFVKPTGHGTVWGVGGTCVNVGCIPKKLMHQAAIIGDVIEDSKAYGWLSSSTSRKNHNWAAMVENVQKHIKKLNFNYIKYFKKNNIAYYNAYVTFKDKHTVEATDKGGKVSTHTAHKFLLATGGRPHIPAFLGNNYAITSDDLFSLKAKPGKTLIIGASYIALECAGFLHGLGIDCTVMVRSILLRGFDQQIAEMIGSHMESIGVNFIKGYIPVEIAAGTWDKVDRSLQYKVKMTSIGAEVNHEKEDYFNLVILATGRDANTKGLGLDLIGVNMNEKNGKVLVNEKDLTSCDTVYAVGDIQDGRMELTPVAIKAGQQVVQRLYNNGGLMDYKLVPTTVFTPLEYGICGYSEEEAVKSYGADVVCYHSQYAPLEWVLPARNPNRCYVKLVCLKSLKYKVIGFHVLGPNAGEITQGFTLALKLNATKSDFDQLVGIHPTCAEIFTSLKETRTDHPEATAADKKDC